uniref:Uncharacterized protein n=1 Tax=Anguilla anguilla TaxID=7936 RepID=A0A0E9UH91_ANGAN
MDIKIKGYIKNLFKTTTEKPCQRPLIKMYKLSLIMRPGDQASHCKDPELMW